MFSLFSDLSPWWLILTLDAEASEISHLQLHISIFHSLPFVFRSAEAHNGRIMPSRETTLYHYQLLNELGTHCTTIVGSLVP